MKIVLLLISLSTTVLAFSPPFPPETATNTISVKLNEFAKDLRPIDLDPDTADYGWASENPDVKLQLLKTQLPLKNVLSDIDLVELPANCDEMECKDRLVAISKLPFVDDTASSLHLGDVVVGVSCHSCMESLAGLDKYDTMKAIQRCIKCCEDKHSDAALNMEVGRILTTQEA